MTDTDIRPVPSRPWEVTTVVVLAYVRGVLDVGLGVLVLFARYDREIRSDGEALVVSLLGAAIILFGLVVIAVASGIARGDRVARVVLTAGVSLSLALDIVVIWGDPGGSWGSVASALLAALILIICWTGRGARHFRKVPSPSV